MFKIKITVCSLVLLLLGFQFSSAQTANQVKTATALAHWINLDAPPGWEHLATDPLTKVLKGWTRDAAGNLILCKGSGLPRRVVACGLDREGFAVTEITEQGYLRLRESGALRQHPLWSQFHEGQRIRVLTRTGSVSGVVAVKSTHLQRGRGPAPITTLEDLWVDVGARSRAEVERLGIQLLDPVVRDLPEWTFTDFVTGPAAGIRVGCAAIASAAQGNVAKGETVFLLTRLRSFGNDGLQMALRKLGHIDELYLVDTIAETGPKTDDRVLRLTVRQPAFVPETAGVTSIVTLAPQTRFTGSLVETVGSRMRKRFSVQ